VSASVALGLAGVWKLVQHASERGAGTFGESPAPAPRGGDFPREVRLPSGELAVVHSRPVRIVPASATAVDLVAALVSPERVAALPVQALEYSGVERRLEGFAHAPRFEAYLAERLLALEPDLVVVDPWQSADTSAVLARAGLAVIELPVIQDLSGALVAIELVARALGEERRGADLIAELERRVAALRASAGRRRGLRALSYSNFGAAGWTAGSATTVHEVLTLAGLTDAAAEAGREGHVEISFEELLALDPDLILVSRPLQMVAGPAGDRGGASEALLRSEASLASLRAVREDRIVALPAWLYATGSHELVSAAEVLAGEVDRLLARIDARSQARSRSGGGEQ